MEKHKLKDCHHRTKVWKASETPMPTLGMEHFFIQGQYTRQYIKTHSFHLIFFKILVYSFNGNKILLKF